MGDTRKRDAASHDRATPASAVQADSANAKRSLETLAPPRNFTITAADRVRAAQGPPAYMRRKRQIEDLDAMLRDAATEALTHARTRYADAIAAARAALDEDPAIARTLAELNRLIASHNRYYPVEANLPFDPVRRIQLDRDRRPYRPLPEVSLDGLVAAAACDGEAHVGKIR
jgi:hypothetical protein